MSQEGHPDSYRDAIISETYYTYNGKELNADFGLDLHDYGARWYDAAVGRWQAIDPLAEAFIVHSPYNYGVNNPIMMIDPDGRMAQNPSLQNNSDGDEDEEPREIVRDEDGNPTEVRIGTPSVPYVHGVSGGTIGALGGGSQVSKEHDNSNNTPAFSVNSLDMFSLLEYKNANNEKVDIFFSLNLSLNNYGQKILKTMIFINGKVYEVEINTLTGKVKTLNNRAIEEKEQGYIFDKILGATHSSNILVWTVRSTLKKQVAAIEEHMMYGLNPLGEELQGLLNVMLPLEQITNNTLSYLKTGLKRGNLKVTRRKKPFQSGSQFRIVLKNTQEIRLGKSTLKIKGTVIDIN